MNLTTQQTPYAWGKSCWRSFAILGVFALFPSLSSEAASTLRGGVNGAQASGNSVNSTTSSQTSTAATTATSTATQTAAASQQAQVSMAHSLHALMAAQAAQNTARAAAISGANNLGTGSTPLSNVPDGLAVGGLAPGVQGVDPANPATTATTIPIQVNSNGSATVIIQKGSAVTLPTNLPANSQVTVSGSGTVGTITTGGTITPLIGGVATTIAPGSTISLTASSAVTFNAGSSVPSTVANYSLPSANSWSGISGLTQATYAPPSGSGTGQTTVTLTQDSQQSLLNWQTFNIGKNTVLDFDQSMGGSNVGNWVSINKVAANIAPSQVLGAIQAPGQVYVINQNGIIFGGSSQVNTHALVASTLPINDNLLASGLLNNPDFQFLFSQLDLAAGNQGPTPAFTPQGTSSAHGTAPAPGSYGSGGIVAHVDSNGALTLAPANGTDGDVLVEAGAQLSAPTTPEHVGGRVALVGPNVSNNGTVTTPDGQTILAAGLQVDFAAHAQTDPSIRGLDVMIGAVSDPTYASGATGLAGTATNNGVIESPRANVTITGSEVFQNGVIDSLTSVTLNGSIDLLANYGATPYFVGNTSIGLFFTQAGNVTLGANSLSQILPDLASTDTVVGTSLALPSEMLVQGNTIHLAANAEILAPSATLSLNAGTWLPVQQGFSFENTQGQVYLDSGSTIDVSGSENVSASVAENIVTADLLGTELANSPVQRNGALRGATVQVDIRDTGNYDGTEWVGTPIGDVSGYVNLIQRTVGELTTAGGTVSIAAGNSVVMQAGSTVNVSGGWINYQGAQVQTSQVVTTAGQVLDISQATPDLVYSGLYTGVTENSPKYGLSQTYSNSLLSSSHYDPGYVQGGSGGSLKISAPSMALDGATGTGSGGFYGYTVAGAYQQTSAATISSTYAGTVFRPTMAGILGVPGAASLDLEFIAQDPSQAGVYLNYSPTPPAITIASTVSPQSPTVAFDSGSLGLFADREDSVYLSTDLLNTRGFGNFSILNSDGSILLAPGASLAPGVGGSNPTANNPLSGPSIVFNAANIDIEGTIRAPGGNIDLESDDVSPYANFTLGSNLPAYDPSRGNITVGVHGSLDVSGLIVNNSSASSSQLGLPSIIDGGSIKLLGSAVDLVAGGVLDANGGVIDSSAGKLTYGKGGSITLGAGEDLNIDGVLGGTLQMDSTLEAYSGASGGSLNLTALLVQVGGTPLDPQNTLLLAPSFFNEGGFSSFTIQGYGEAKVDSNGNATGDYLPAVSIADGTSIAPIVTGLQAVFQGNDIALTPLLQALPSERSAANLTFEAPGVTESFEGNSVMLVRGDFLLGTGASVVTDPQVNSHAGVSVNAQTAAILGSIIAPGGTISITGASTFPSASTPTVPLLTVDLGPTSFLSTAGTTEYTVNPYGYTTGSVLAGGAITVSGNILAEAGSVLDASGATAQLDLVPGSSGTSAHSIALSRPVSTRVDSAGGSITLTGGNELFTDATLKAAAGGPSAAGGSLTISSGIFTGLGVITNPSDVTLSVSQDAINIPVPQFYSANGSAIGTAVVDAQGNVIAGRGYFSASAFDNANSGFDSLTLGGSVGFVGSVTIDARGSLSVGSKGFISLDPAAAGSVVILSAPYVDLGQAFQGPLTAQTSAEPIFFDSANNPYYAAPTGGTDTLTVNAGQLIDIGNLDLQNVGHLNLNAGSGDVRGDGILDAAATVLITAGQVYPTTETTFMIADYDHDGIAGSVTIQTPGGALPQIPLSAGGTLDIYASDITQNGVLRAPIGTINLGSGVTSAPPADLISGLSVPATQQLILGSASTTSVSALEPDGDSVTLPYGTVLNGVSYIDPSGVDITLGGVPGKSINLSGVSVNDQSGSVLDIAGGGDLYAYRFVSGTGGTVDVLNTTTSFAIIPTYESSFAPIDPTYGNSVGNSSTLHVGDEIYLAGGNGLAAGNYTLLPARYALLPGAYLVTPQSGAPTATIAQTNGAALVSGYRFNALDPLGAAPLSSLFSVAPESVVRASAEYDDFSANTFLSQSAKAGNVAVPRLPSDAGQIVFAAQQTMTIDGSLRSTAAAGALGSEIDISSPSAIYIGDASSASNAPAGDLFLDAASLTAFGADSLLIGGYRQQTSSGIEINVATNSLTVANANEVLAGPDVILVSNQSLAVDAGARIEQSGSLTGAADTLLLGSSSVAGSGDGALLRVTSDPNAQIIRSGVDSQQTQAALPIGTTAFLNIGAGALISGASVTLDSTFNTQLDASATLQGSSVALNSGEISLELSPLAQSPTSGGLVLSSTTLQTLESTVQNLSLLSYNAIDIYGSGDMGAPLNGGSDYSVASITLHADAIRGDGGVATFNARTISIDNSSSGVESGAGPVSANGGTLNFNADTINLGQSGQLASNSTSVEGYGDVVIDSRNEVILQSAGTTPGDGTATKGMYTFSVGSTGAPANLTIQTPLLTGATGANQAITATGDLEITSVASPTTLPSSSGLGAALALTGDNVALGTLLAFHSGMITATATAGDITLEAEANLDASGVAQTTYDLTAYTSGGIINLASAAGSINASSGAILNVSAPGGGGNGGAVELSVAQGSFNFAAGTVVSGTAGATAQGAQFSLDAATIANGDLAALHSLLNAGGFAKAISIRDRQDANVTVDGTARTGEYDLSADQGSILVTGTIDASNVASTDAAGNSIQIGGTINLEATGSVELASTAHLDASGQSFSNAGKGGSITLGAGNYTSANPSNTTAFVTVDNGASMNLSVAAVDSAANVTSATANAEALGDFTGTLVIEAPQILDGSGNPTGVQVNPILGAIDNASSITVVGQKVYQPAGGVIDTIDGANGAVMTNGNQFAVAMGTTTSSAVTTTGTKANAIFTGAQISGPTPVINFAAGAEVINPTGDLVLQHNWDLSTFRAGVNNLNQAVAGVLTLRAAGNLVFNLSASLSDGFIPATGQGFTDASNGMWQAALMPAGSQSWSYNLVAGADFSAADALRVQSLAAIASNSGSLLLGKGSTALPTATNNVKNNAIIPKFFQTIRTGTGNIEIAASRNVEILDPLATIYTAGTQAAPLANFDTPNLTYPSGTRFGTPQTPTPIAQYSTAGGNVSIAAGNDIVDELISTSGVVTPYSTREIPTSWLYRRGFVLGGQFSATHSGGDVESTSWWVSFSNFFEGVGALGGGNVTLNAGHDVSNVDAVIPTNARMPKGTPDASALIELGGGDLVVRAGNDINGGVYYVERGQGQLEAGNSVVTNSTRAVASTTQLSTFFGSTPDPATWLPTTFFLGEGSFDVEAGNEAQIGPVANPFLLPQNLGNSFYDRTYFSTYSATSSVSVSTLVGSLTLEDHSDTGTVSLASWYQTMYQQLLSPVGGAYALSEPWLGLVETDITSFETSADLMAPTLRATAFSGDINLVGGLILSPSASGTLTLDAAGSINGVRNNGFTDGTGSLAGGYLYQYGSSTIDLSDANPSSLPSPASPLSLTPGTGGLTVGTWSALTDPSTFASLDDHFAVSGSTQIDLQTEEALHDPGLLHLNDDTPVYIYAEEGDISGLTLFSGKFSQVAAGEDITDVSLYVQNDRSSDVTLVQSGRDIIPYDANSFLRNEAQTSDSQLFGESDQTPLGTGIGGPNAGDIQVAGPGTVEILAGRNLNLGVGPGNGDGTGVGISTIGGTVDPYLPFDGADVVAAAGLAPSSGLSNSLAQPDVGTFIDQFLNPNPSNPNDDPDGSLSARYLPDLGSLLSLPDSSSNAQIWAAFNQLPPSLQRVQALKVFYLVLRDSGRDHNSGTDPATANYENGYAAIQALFPNASGQSGDITLTAREIKTTNGGDISLLAPAGKISVGLSVTGTQPIDQGILTVSGGNINIFTEGNVDVGTSRIFTLHGGNEIIFSAAGDIAAGASSKTVQSAPPTRVLVNPQSADVETDLAGLATGGGIGVLETIVGAPPADVDLIAPKGTVDAGDAGIRVSGNLNIAAEQVLNASHISVGGTSAGTPAAPAAPNLAGLSAASNAVGATSSVASDQARRAQGNQSPGDELPSIITVDVIGYGG